MLYKMISDFYKFYDWNKLSDKPFFKCFFVLQNNTTFRFSSLVYGLYALHRLFIHRILKFQGSQLRMRINKKPNGKQKWSKDREKLHFCWLVTSLLIYLKSIAVRSDVL